MFGFNFDAMVMVPVKEMLGTLYSFVPTVFGVLVVLVGGWIVAKIVRHLVEKSLEMINLEDFSDRLGISGVLDKGGINMTLTEVISSLVYSISMIMVLFLALNAFGIALPVYLFDGFVGYIPSVLVAVFVLVLGIFIANFISLVIRATARNLGLPRSGVLEDISRWAIVIFALTISLKSLGLGMLFEGETFKIFFTSICVALAIAFGLGGKDMAGKYLKDLRK